MIPRIKICCISSEDEARIAIESGASAIGLVSRMPSGPGPIPDELIRQIAKTVPPPIGTFLLTSETSVKEIIEHHHRTNTNTIQIVDSLSSGTYSQIKAALPSVKIVQVIHVIDERSVDEAIEISEMVDAILLDSGNPKLKVKVSYSICRICTILNIYLFYCRKNSLIRECYYLAPINWRSG